MITCICHNVSDKKIKEVATIHPQIQTVKELKSHLHICAKCCKCKPEIKSIIQSCRDAQKPTIPVDESEFKISIRIKM